MDYNLSVHGILQARMQEWAAISLGKLINLSLPQFLKLENEQSTRMCLKKLWWELYKILTYQEVSLYFVWHIQALNTF